MSEKLKELRMLDARYDQAKNHVELSRSNLPYHTDEAYRQILALQGLFDEGGEALKSGLDSIAELRTKLDNRRDGLVELETVVQSTKETLASFVTDNDEAGDERFQSSISQIKRKLDMG
jgi:hypothetical protein